MAFKSLLSLDGPEPAARLLRSARQRVASPGEVLIGADETDRAGVLVEGLLRTVISLPDGRAATIHYPSPVAFVGLPTIFVPAPLSVHVIRTATVVELDAEELRRSAREYPQFGLFVSRQLAAAVGRVPSIIEEFAFRTVSQRIASHLIALSEPDGITGALTARVTQAALAEYVGSVREVVTGCLQSLAHDGLVALGRGTIRIDNEDGLRRLALHR
jgi:CRP-like cAMP-binding protein